MRLSSGDPSVLDSSTPGDYTVQLGQNINCEGHCGMYLLEASVPFTWFNVSSADGLTITEGQKTEHLKVTPAYYESVSALVAEINKALAALSLSAVKLTADQTSKRVSIDCGAQSITGSLLSLLGWPTNAIVKGKDQQAPRMADITRGVNSVYVYLDCIEPTNAGSFSVPLIKQIPIGGFRPGDVIQYRQRLPVEVHKLNTPTLRQIAVSVKDVHNQVIDFNGFNVELLLAIQPKT